MEEDNVKAIKEIILDEQRLVTYLTVSKELCIHVNEAKILLRKVVEEIKKHRPDIVLNVNFIVSGLSNENVVRITVCSEADKDKTTTSMKSIFFLHIYSVSQGCSAIDNAVLASTNKFADFPFCIGLIKTKTCSKRSLDEIGTLKSNSQSAIDEATLSNLHRKIKSDDVVKIQESKSEPKVSIKSEIPSPKKDVKTNKGNGIVGYFTKANSVPNIKQAKVSKNDNEKKPIKDKRQIKVDAMNVDNINTDSNDKNELANKSETDNKKDQKTSATKNNYKKETKNSSQSKEKLKSVEVIKKNAKVDKKRKRLLHVSDSESDVENDLFAVVAPVEQDSDDEIPPTPSTNTVKITSGIVNPKKKRKIVDKTYTDEDGYILTRKVEVYESFSENEEETSVKENIMQKNQVKTEMSPKQIKAKGTKKKISPTQKGKQASIMNFFQKK